MNTRTLNPANAADASRAIDTLVTAFAADPAVRWMYPEAQQYLEHFPDFARAFGGNAIAAGTADYAEGFAGAALWLPPGVQPDEQRVVEVLQRSVAAEKQAEVFSLLEQMGRFHPAGPHWYLPLIGVDPRAQGRGCGSALLQHALERCDREELPAYLESTNPRNIALYERHGFRALGEIRAGSSPVIVPMLRDANSN